MLRFLFVLVLFGVVTYLLVRMLQQRGVLPDEGQRGAAGRPQQRRPQPPPRAVAPDDDEDFLRELDRKRKHGEPEE